MNTQDTATVAKLIAIDHERHASRHDHRFVQCEPEAAEYAVRLAIYLAKGN